MTNTLTATLRTNRGPVVVRLFPDHAPKTVRNFVELAEGTREWTNPVTRKASQEPLYDGTVFHRVIPDFMIQGGDPLGTGTGGPGYKFADEFHPDLAFDRPYLLAMANAGPGTNGSQFFITTVPTPWLTGKHTIFGEVIDGGNVVDEISRVQTSRGDRPATRRRAGVRRDRARRERVGGSFPMAIPPDQGQAPQDQTQAAPPVCYRHPGRPTYVSCVRCGKPACPDCLRPAAVGHQCVDCIRSGNQGVRQASGRFGGAVTAQRQGHLERSSASTSCSTSSSWPTPSSATDWCMLGVGR